MNEVKRMECEPTQYDKDAQMLYKAASLQRRNLFTTVDEKGVPHTGIMGGIFFHPTLGFRMCTHESKKAVQIRKNRHGRMALDDEKTSDEYIFDVECKMVWSEMLGYALWRDIMKGVGYKGREDTKVMDIGVRVKKGEVVKMKELWKKDSGK
jgi:hypothetical protein